MRQLLHIKLRIKAGVRGQWELATYYRFGKIKNDENISYYDQYFDISENSNDVEPSYYYQLAELHAQFAKGQNDRAKKRDDYQTALAFFVDAVEHGLHSAYKNVKETATALLPLMDPDARESLDQEIRTIITEHLDILNLLEREETILVGELLSELTLGL